MRSFACVALSVAAVLVLCTGCDDDGTRPPIPLADAWPHVDGTAWTYAMRAQFWEDLDLPGGDGSLPDMETLHADLRQPIAAAPREIVDYRYTLAFAGEVTTDTGVTAQHLVQQLEPLAPAVGEEETRADLRLGALIDPLRAGIAEVVPSGPTLLRGYAFAWEDSGYYGYGDLVADHSWTYLEGALRPGGTFVQRLAPGLVADAWLHGRVWSVGTRTIGGRRYADVVEVMYVVDLGEATGTDEQGEPIGPVRNLTYGTVMYAAGVGPVALAQRTVGLFRDAYDPQSHLLVSDVRCELEDVSLPD